MMMNKINTRIIIGSFVLFLLGLSSCKKWVDQTDQPLQVDESEVFSTEKGFREALNGVYLQMGAESLYGKNFTMGMLSLAGRSYDSVSMVKAGALYYNAATLNLKSPEVVEYASTVWSDMYTTIANINHLLEQVEKHKTVFTGNNYQKIKGEAVALRAYLHFDLVRLFAPIQPDADGIPYVTTFDNRPVETDVVSTTIDKCIADLQEALSLMDEDTTETSQMNHWAIKGLLARIYLYRGDRMNANKNAQDIIGSNRFVLTSKSNTNLLFTNESLFKLYIYSNNYYSFYKAFFGTPIQIGLSASGQNSVYGTGNSDYRRSFIDATTGLATGTPLMPKKFTYSASNIFPMLRLTEMYYIAAECATDVEQGLSYINPVRESRNLAPLTNAEVGDLSMLKQVIAAEYRKEFIGEGQVFFYYKRNNTAFDQLPFYPKTPPASNTASLPVVENATYTFVKPE